MSETISNTQTQQATSFNQGTNKVTKLDARSFFFLAEGVLFDDIHLIWCESLT